MSKGRHGPYRRTLLTVFVQSLSPYPFGTRPLTKRPQASCQLLYFERSPPLMFLYDVFNLKP